MTQGSPNIEDYSGYRQYLYDCYRILKSKDGHFSHRHINRKAGVRSSGWFADILAGRQKLKSKHVGPIASVFKLGTRECEFLKALVELENATTSEERAAACEKWLNLKGVRRVTVAKDKMAYFEHWYYPALRELLTLESYGGNYADLASKLSPPITPIEAKMAVELLKRLGLLLQGSPTPLPVLVKGASKTPHWNRILKEFISLSAPALDRFAKEERDFSALTLSFSPEGLKRAGEEIAMLRKRLLILSERDKEKNRVFQGLFQLFPVSDIIRSAS